MSIHATAIVSSGARIHETAEIGPNCIIGDDVEIGAHTRLMAHIYCEGVTVIGEQNLFYPYSTVGVASQDKKYKGERAETRIGNGNTIREFVTIHRGTQGGGLVTQIGNGNLLMAYVHVAHDVRIGDNTTLANGVTFAGHVTVEDYANIGAHSGVHQFCRIGRHSIIGGYSVVVQDVLPFSNTVSEREIRVFGANRIGMERAGFPGETIEGLQTALRLLTRAGLNTTQAIERIQAEVPETPELNELMNFIRTSSRGVIKG
jgi:UDP-N-acetylglucosamine acyltransferase